MIADRFSLKGRVALVTGASRGLGWAMATALAEAGATLILCGRDEATLDERVQRLKASGARAGAAVFDVAERGAAAAVVEAAVKEHGRLDILVNNAGINHRQSLADFTDEDWDRVIATNLSSCFSLAREAARPMAEQGWGRIVNTASLMGPHARPTVIAYVAAKGGVRALTRALAVELGPKGITCNAIAPGYFRTEMTEPLAADAEFDAFVRARTPLGRWGKPEDLAGAVVFLASDAGAYVNGHVLAVDGGMSVAV
jgi:gluconate 5-dehydrogenase